MLGGGISREGEAVMAPVRAYVGKYGYARGSAKQPRIVAASLAGDAGIIGAALLGGLGAVMTPAASASASGWALALVGVLLVGLLRELRRFQSPEIVNES